MSHQREGQCAEIEEGRSEIMTIEDMERHLILLALKRHDGNRTHAASTLGISLRTLRNKINAYQSMGLSIPNPS